MEEEAIVGVVVEEETVDEEEEEEGGTGKEEEEEEIVAVVGDAVYAVYVYADPSATEPTVKARNCCIPIDKGVNSIS